MKVFVCTIAMLIGLTGCGFKYTEVINDSLSGQKIKPTTFIVFPVTDLTYRPPESCFIPVDLSKGPACQESWNEDVKKKLIEKFPNEKWIFLGKSDAFFKSEEHSLHRIIALGEEQTRSKLINMADSDVVQYTVTPQSQAMNTVLKDLYDSTHAEYAIMFNHPSLTGEVQTSYTMNGNGMMSGSSQTYYMSDIRVQIWQCQTGKLMYCSGGWSKESGFCFFISPEDAAIKSATSQIVKKLIKVISEIIQGRSDCQTAQSMR
jgi:hypothetical protein